MSVPSNRTIWTCVNGAISIADMVLVWLFFWPYLSTAGNWFIGAAIVLAIMLFGIALPACWFFVSLVASDEFIDKLIEGALIMIFAPMIVILVLFWPSIGTMALWGMTKAYDCGVYGAPHDGTRWCLDVLWNNPQFWQDEFMFSAIWWVVAAVIVAVLWVRERLS